ncbi:MAG: phosphate signaling complex protein PhoU [Erysipelotrichaceae bacterium]
MVKLDDINQSIKDKLLEMANKVIAMHALALETINEEDNEKALKVIKMDDIVNAYEEDVNTLVLESLALLSPVAKDLRHAVAAIKIASELERIGDYAKNMVKFTIKQGKLDNELKEKVLEIGNIFISMLDHSMDAYNKQDVNWAYQIPEEDNEINERYKIAVKLLEDALTQNTQLDGKNIIYIFSLMRNLERAGDHTKNICEHIVYEVKGHHVEFD